MVEQATNAPGERRSTRRKPPQPVHLRHPDGRMVTVTPGDVVDDALAAEYPHLFSEPESEADE